MHLFPLSNNGVDGDRNHRYETNREIRETTLGALEVSRARTPANRLYTPNGPVEIIFFKGIEIPVG